MKISQPRMCFVEPSAPARRLLWHALSLGSVTRDEPERHAGYDKPGVFLFWVVEGLGRMEVEGADYPLERGDCCWLVDLRADAESWVLELSRLLLALCPSG